MTNMIIIGISFIAGIAIGGGSVLMFINQRKIPLDKWTDSFKINRDDLENGDKIPISILDTEYGDTEVCKVTLLEHDQHERVELASWIEDALNRHRG